MKFDLNNLNPGTWFDDGDGGRVCLRVLSTEKAAEITKKTSKTEAVYKDGKRYEYTRSTPEQEDAAFALVNDYCIVDWDGQVSSDGVAIPCTKEMKAALMLGSPVFAQFVNEKLTLLRDALEAARADEEKN